MPTLTRISPCTLTRRNLYQPADCQIPIDLSALDQLPTGLPVVYVTLGSSGQSSLLPTLLGALGRLPITVIAATAGRVTPTQIPDNVRIADFLSGAAASEVSNLVICNGGSPTSYQALAAGKPVIGIATNMDQYLNMSLLQRAGAGRLLRAAQVTGKLVADTVIAALADTQMKQRAHALKAILERYRYATDFETLVARAANAGSP